MKTSLSIAVMSACVLLGSCADDGPDVALEQRRVAERAAELRAAVVDVPAGSAEVASEIGVDADPATSVAPSSAAATVEPTGVIVPVIALDNSFRPEVIEINVGDEVFWENRGQNEHNVLRVEGEGWGVDVHNFQPGAAYAHVFTEPGEYRYFCSIHGTEDVGMVGTVIVTG